MAKTLNTNGTLKATTLVIKNDADVQLYYNGTYYDLETLIKRIMYLSSADEDFATVVDYADVVGSGSSSYIAASGTTFTVSGVNLTRSSTLNLVTTNLWIQGIGSNSSYYYNVTSMLCDQSTSGVYDSSTELYTLYTNKERYGTTTVPTATWTFGNVVLTGSSTQYISNIYLNSYNLGTFLEAGTYATAKEDDLVTVDGISTSTTVIDL